MAPITPDDPALPPGGCEIQTVPVSDAPYLLARPTEAPPAHADAPAVSTWDVPEADAALNVSGDPLRVLNLHNIHAERGGMEVYFDAMTAVLRDHGHKVETYTRDSAEIATPLQKVRAFASAVHSPSSREAVRTIIERERINLVHLHNVWPLISFSVLTACREAFGGRGVPVVMSVQDYKLTCPAGQHRRDGKVCTKCVGGNEHWCAIHGCRQNRVWSAAYAVRNVVTRRRGLVKDGVTLYLPCSNFVRDHLVGAGYNADRVRTLPNFTALPDEPVDPVAKARAPYISFVGRVSPEKGLDVLLDAARRTGLPVKIAGDASAMPELVASAPPNVQFVGRLDREQLPDFYRNSRFSVVPSNWLECFGIVSAEAQGYGTPVIASDIGGLSETVQDGVTGRLVPAGDAAALADTMRNLWDDPVTLAGMSRAAQRRARREFSTTTYYRRLAAAYGRACELHRADAEEGEGESGGRFLSLPQAEAEAAYA